MKKISTVTLFLFFLFVFNRQTLAVTPFIHINPNIVCAILGNCPTNTPTPTPIPVDCATKGCDNSTNPCKSGLTCIQANNGSNYCSFPEFVSACKANPSADTCCSELPTVTSSPTITTTPLYTPTQKPEESVSPSPLLSVSPTTIISISPTQPKPTESSNAMVKDVGIGLVIGFLLLLVVAQSWPRIKSWLHDKTK